MSENKPRLLFLCQNYYPEMVSTGLHMTELTEHLVPSYNIDVFCSYPSDRVAFDKSKINYRDKYKGVSVTRSFNLGAHNKGLVSRALYGMGYFIQAFVYTLFKSGKYDLIVITTNPPYLGILSYFLNLIFGKKYIIIVHDIYPEVLEKLKMLSNRSIMYRFWEFMNRRVFNKAHRIIVLGRDAKEIIKGKIKSSNARLVHVITSWSDPRKVFPIKKENNSFLKEQKLDGKFVVLYSGNMGRTHNIEPFLEAAKEIDDDEIVFLFIGDGKKSELVLDEIKERPDGNVRWLPLQPSERLSEVLSAGNIALVCLEEAFTGYSVPSKTYGIMASGRPIIALLSAESEIGHTIRKFSCGKLVTNNPEEIKKWVLEAKAKPETWNELGENGLNAFRNNFTIEKVTLQYVTLINEVLSE